MALAQMTQVLSPAEDPIHSNGLTYPRSKAEAESGTTSNTLFNTSAAHGSQDCLFAPISTT